MNKKEKIMICIKKVFISTITSCTMLTSSASAVDPVLTDTQLHAVLGVVTNFILDDGGITHNGVKYDTVTSPYTGRVWLDRNLGASQVCTSATDTACYGDYYQWGRGHDGHQSSSSLTTATQATDVNSVGHGDFIVGSLDWASVDGVGETRRKNWFADGSSSLCPVGYRVPTFAEIKAELVDVGTAQASNNADAYNSFLKMPSAGFRNYSSANIVNTGTSGFIWSSSSSPTKAYFVGFSSSVIYQQEAKRASGVPVRCIDCRFDTPKKTGQTQSYDASGTVVTDGSQKDDGFYQKGTPPSYTRDNAKDIVIDHVTGLQWQDDPAVATVTKPWLTAANNVAPYTDTTGDTATTYCSNLTLGGYSDWRLPTREELVSLSVYGQITPAIDATFQNTASSTYWSSTTYASSASNVWVVNFSTSSQINFIKSYGGKVRCVRAGDAVTPPDFTKTSNIVTDNNTGLQWQDDATGSPMDWQAAIDHCEALSLDGFSDWRLPNLKELTSIVDDSISSPAIESTFQNTASSHYWSSTTFVVDVSRAWRVNFNSGPQVSNTKSNGNFVRCVRAGQ